MPTDIKLRPHQIEAIDAAVRALDIPAGGKVPADGLRATVVSACGTGKTWIAAFAALRLVRHGRILVLVPTLDLLTQTVSAWREAGHAGPMVAVCSLEDDPTLWQLRVRTTTSAPQLALWHGTGPVVAFATYASLPVLAEAFEGIYGVSLDAFDLAAVDEAHRTSGSIGKAWAAIHDNTVIRADRRLYLTATPRIWEVREPRRPREGAYQPLTAELAASMSDPKIFGPVAFRLTLADAVARGLLARYRIIVAELRDPVINSQLLAREEGRSEEIRGKRLGALQAAVLHTAAEENLNTLITFHHRTLEAAAFAEGLPAVATKLHTEDPSLYPQRIWAGWLCGEHEAAHRRQVLDQFASGTDEKGVKVECAVISNCKVLGEGIDAPMVDSVAFCDPKGSAVDIVQAIGRALRQKPGQGKMATLIVPVFLEPGEKPEDMLTSASYAPLVKILTGLRAHDEQAVEMLAVPQERTPPVHPSPDIGAAPEEGEEDNRLLLRFSSRRDPATVADFVSLRIINTERQDWNRGYAALKRYQETFGHVRVPLDYRDPATDYPTGGFVSEQRRTYKARTMDAERIERLEKLGMIWDVAEEQFQDNLAAARAYFAQHGSLAAPQEATALDKPLGRWLANIRRTGGLGKDPERAAQRRAALEAIDPDWNPTWPIDWQRHYAGLRTLIDADGTLAEIVPGVTYGGDDIGRWLVKQRAQWGRLSEGQRERLTQLGVEPLPEHQAQQLAKPPRRSRADMFDTNLAAARQYHAREGHLTVPRKHIEILAANGGTDGADGKAREIKLGVWISNIRSRRDKLTPERAAALNELGIRWTT